MLDDLWFGLRRTLRFPGSSLGIVCILAAGIGATGAMVSVFDALVVRPLNIPQPDTLVAVVSLDAGGERRLMPLTAADELSAAGLPAEGWCGYNMIFESTESGGRTMPARVALVTGDCHRVLGVAPALGRGIDRNDAPLVGTGQPVAVIT